jgi:hypothetical protein
MSNPAPPLIPNLVLESMPSGTSLPVALRLYTPPPPIR